MLNKVRILAGLSLVALMAVWLIGGNIDAGGTTPGTVNDPLITKSYVDMKIETLRDELTALFERGRRASGKGAPTNTSGGLNMKEVEAYIDSQVAAQIADLDLEGSGGSSSPDTEDTTGGSMLFEVVRAVNGQRLVCGASAEVILRAGAAEVIAGENGDGLADLTSGMDLAGGDEVPKNHHLLVSRDDGRGLHIVLEGGYTYILVKGDYTLE